jgi:cyclophilin family peptidyl-prolyl cis-trans isomerase
VRHAHHFVVAALLAALILAACASQSPSGGLQLFTETPGAGGSAATQPLSSGGGSAATPPGQPGQPTPPGLAMQWDAPPPMTIDPSRHYLAILKTEKGDIEVELLADKAPVTVNNFIFLARQGFYDNTTFHRVLQDFMAQGGDPTATGTGGPGYEFQDEFHPDVRFDEPGLLAMANAGPNTNGSQFFITFVPTPHLNGRHTIFGKVVGGMDVLKSIRLRDPQANPDYPGDRLITVEIQEVAESRLPPATATPLPNAPVAADGRPLAALPVEQRAGLYNAPPQRVIDVTQTYTATIATTQGDIVVRLFPADAPESVNNFVVLANLGYWDGFPIVYAEPDSFVLTGSPAGSPDSDIGYTLPPEVKRANSAGAVGYWYREDQQASSGSQFYIALQALPDADSAFTAFGQVVAGQDVAGKLTTADSIKTITIEAP